MPSILIKCSQKTIKIDRKRIRSVMAKLLRHLQCDDKEISVVFVDNDEMQKINNTYLDRNHPTNVISFPASAPGAGDFENANPEILGDIVISAERALRDSQRDGLSFDDEIDFLSIHGLLHLLGYNHENTTQKIARIMKKKERELFSWLKGYEL
jgi:probable rRNA maturation factor